jgi:hypothetical protein
VHQRHRVGRLVHIEDAEPPLHEGDDPPVVKVRENRRRTQPGVRQALQRLQGRLQPVLARRRRHAVPPRVGLLLQKLGGVGQKAGLVVAEVEPPRSHSALLEVIVQGM